MNIDIALPSNNIEPSNVYLDGMKGYPNPRCQPTINNQVASFRLPLKDFYECGVTRIVHKLNVSSIFNFEWFFFHLFLTCFFFWWFHLGSNLSFLQGQKVFKHKIIIEEQLSEQAVTVECTIFAPYKVIKYAGHNITRRDTGLPLDFVEPMYGSSIFFSSTAKIVNLFRLFSGISDLDITTVEHKAPVPNVNIGVRQGGQPVTGELNVSPGTPLSMEIYLDDTSSKVYGLGVTFMLVTDNKSQEETIIFNGYDLFSFIIKRNER